MSPASIHEVSRHLGLACIPHDYYAGSDETDEGIGFQPDDSDASYTLAWSERDLCWVLDSQFEISEGVYGLAAMFKLPCADPVSALAVAAAVEGVYRGLIDEFEAIR